MNTISSTESSLEWYQKIQDLQKQIKEEKEKQEQQLDTSSSLNETNSQSNSNFSFSTSSSTTTANPLDTLSSEGIMTEIQETAVQNAFKAAFQANKTNAGTYNKITNPLDTLVSDGTITEDQKTAIQNLFQSNNQ